MDVYEDVRLLSPSAALLQSSASAELLVVGRAGRTLGPTVRGVLEHAGTRWPWCRTDAQAYGHR